MPGFPAVSRGGDDTDLLPLKEEFYYVQTPGEGATWKRANFRLEARRGEAGCKPLLRVCIGKARQEGQQAGRQLRVRQSD